MPHAWNPLGSVFDHLVDSNGDSINISIRAQSGESSIRLKITQRANIDAGSELLEGPRPQCTLGNRLWNLFVQPPPTPNPLSLTAPDPEALRSCHDEKSLVMHSLLSGFQSIHLMGATTTSVVAHALTPSH